MLRHSSPQAKSRNSRIIGLGALLAFAGLAVTPRAETPLTLADAMRATLLHSEEAQMMTEKETRLDAQKSEVFAGALPNVQLYANAGRGSSPFDPTAIGGPDSIGVFNPVLNRYSYGVQVNQSLFSFGRLGQAYKVAGIQQRSQAASNQRSRQQLELQVLEAYYAVVVTRAQLQVIEASLKRQTEATAFIESNFKMGAGQRSSMLLTTSALKALVPQRIRAESNVDAARMALNRLLGRPVQSFVELDTNTMAFATPVVDTSTAGIQSILERRPDVQSLELQKEVMSGLARVNRMMYRPSLGANGKVGILAYKLNDQLHDFDKNLDWQVGIGLQWPIFDGFAQSSKAKQYDSDARTVAHAENQARAFAQIEIAGALHEAAAADTAYQAARESRDAADDARQLLTEDFRSGKGQVTDLLTAEEGLRNAEFGVLGARYQKVRAEAALRVALGMDLIEGDSK